MRRVLQARPSQSRSSPGRYPGRPRYSGAAPAAFAATQFRYYLLLPVPTSAAGVVKSDVDGSISSWMMPPDLMVSICAMSRQDGVPRYSERVRRSIEPADAGYSIQHTRW